MRHAVYTLASLSEYLPPANAGVTSLCSLYIFNMTVNPYVSHIIEQTGMSEREVITSMMPSLRPMTFPCEIHGRHFETHDEYLNELHEYLNGM